MNQPNDTQHDTQNDTQNETQNETQNGGPIIIYSIYYE